MTTSVFRRWADGDGVGGSSEDSIVVLFVVRDGRQTLVIATSKVLTG